MDKDEYFGTLRIFNYRNNDFQKVIVRQLEINVDIWNPESFVRKYFEKDGYKVTKLRYKFVKRNFEDAAIVDDFVSKHYRILGELTISNYLSISGVPDFLVYKIDKGNIIELFFVEVKSKYDTLKTEQLLWVFQNDIPVKFIICEFDKLK